MNRRKPEQIVKLLRKADEELAKGKLVEDFCREEQISAATYYRWQRKYGGLQVDDAKRLKALEVENAKLKRLLAESMLANDAIREFLEKKDDASGTPYFACRYREKRAFQTGSLSLDRNIPIREPIQVATP
jgi:putative transposase